MREQLVELALEVLKSEETEMEFKALWTKVIEMSKMDAEQSIEYISDFYTDLSLDNRFIGVDKTKWDLRSRRKFEETLINTDELIDDEEEKVELEEE